MLPPAHTDPEGMSWGYHECPETAPQQVVKKGMSSVLKRRKRTKVWLATADATGPKHRNSSISQPAPQFKLRAP